MSACELGPSARPQGVRYLVESELLEWRAEALAEFLYKEDGLNKTAIGNFLGERYSEHARPRQIDENKSPTMPQYIIIWGVAMEMHRGPVRRQHGQQGNSQISFFLS